MAATGVSRNAGGSTEVTRGVVLRTIRHTEGRLIARICTDRFGTRGVLVRAGRGGVTPAALQPLSRVELVVVAPEGRDLLLARELRVERPYVNLARDPLRGTLALFTQELLVHVLREEVEDPELFATLQEMLEELDAGTDPAGFPLRAMVALLPHLGIVPVATAGDPAGFDLREGLFFAGRAPHELCMSAERARVFNALLGGAVNDLGTTVPGAVRRALLGDLLTYFRLHVEAFGELRSPEVLHAVLA